MPSALPIADPAPADGLLPATVADGWAERAFGVYVHVPFCKVRCGYCDFNTYTAAEIRGVRQGDYAGQALAEIVQAERVLAATGATPRPASTVFFGGGTPSRMPASEFARILAAIPRVSGAEISAEINPEDVDPVTLAGLRSAGVTRASVGLQTFDPRFAPLLNRA